MTFYQAHIWYLFTHHGIEALIFLLLAFLLGLWWAYLHWFANTSENPAVQESEKLRRRKRELELRRDTLKAKSGTLDAKSGTGTAGTAVATAGGSTKGTTASGTSAGTASTGSSVSTGSSAGTSAKTGSAASGFSASGSSVSGAATTGSSARASGTTPVAKGSASTASSAGFTSSAPTADKGKEPEAADEAEGEAKKSAWEKLQGKSGSARKPVAKSRTTLTNKPKPKPKPVGKSRSTLKTTSSPVKSPTSASSKVSPAIAAAVEKQFSGEKVHVDERLGIIYEEAPETVDNLKKIKGVGKVIENKLHDFGVYRFKQIANWKKSHVEAFTEELSTFKDRIERDEWIKQAKVLAKASK